MGLFHMCMPLSPPLVTWEPGWFFLCAGTQLELCLRRCADAVGGGELCVECATMEGALRVYFLCSTSYVHAN